MGREIAAAWPAAARVFDVAEEATGIPIRRLCFEGPEDQLVKTSNLQPCVVACGLATLAASLSEAGYATTDTFALGRVASPPSFLAGHSVGEYAALAASGALAIRDCLALVAQRGRSMLDASQRRPGAMLALLGGSAAAASKLCSDIRDKIDGSYLDVANLNAPDQTVIAGDLESIAKAAQAAPHRGFRRAVPLLVAGAFHSAAMLPAGEELARRLTAVAIESPSVSVIGNIDARPLGDAASVRQELSAQVASPVRWSDSVALIASLAVSEFFEVGPGQVLTRLVPRIAEGVNAFAIGDPAGVERLAARLKGS